MKVLSQSDNQVDSRFSLGGGNTVVALVLGFSYSVHQIESYFVAFCSFFPCSLTALWVEGGSKQNGVRVHATDYEIYV